jgi:hypothetical protein
MGLNVPLNSHNNVLESRNHFIQLLLKGILMKKTSSFEVHRHKQIKNFSLPIKLTTKLAAWKSVCNKSIKRCAYADERYSCSRQLESRVRALMSPSWKFETKIEEGPIERRIPFTPFDRQRTDTSGATAQGALFIFSRSTAHHFMPNMREKPLAGARSAKCDCHEAALSRLAARSLRNMPQSPCFCVNGKILPRPDCARLKLPPGFGNTCAWIYSGILNRALSAETMIPVIIIHGIKTCNKIKTKTHGNNIYENKLTPINTLCN